MNLIDLRAMAVALAAKVTARELDEEAKRRWAIVKELDDSPAAAQIESIQAKLKTIDQADAAAADEAARRSMAEWIRFEREQKAAAERQQRDALPTRSLVVVEGKNQETEQTLKERAKSMKQAGKQVGEIKEEIMPVLISQYGPEKAEHEWETIRRGCYPKK